MMFDSTYYKSRIRELNTEIKRLRAENARARAALRRFGVILGDEPRRPAMPDKQCPCGSGKAARALYDGHGIYMTLACDDCETEKVSRFRPDIFERYQTNEPIEPEE